MSFDTKSFLEDLLSSVSTEDNVVEHHGIRGMHWGRHLPSAELSGGGHKSIGGPNLSVKAGHAIIGSVKKHGSIGGPNLSIAAGRKIISTVKGHRSAKQAHILKTAHPDHKAIQPLRKKKVHQLSNDEIKLLVARKNLEKQFKDINAREINKGVQITGKILGQAGNQFVSGLTSAVVNEAVKATVGAAKGKKNAANMLF